MHQFLIFFPKKICFIVLLYVFNLCIFPLAFTISFLPLFWGLVCSYFSRPLRRIVRSFIWQLCNVSMMVVTTINFPLDNAFATPHKFWCFFLSPLFDLRMFFISLHSFCDLLFIQELVIQSSRVCIFSRISYGVNVQKMYEVSVWFCFYFLLICWDLFNAPAYGLS